MRGQDKKKLILVIAIIVFACISLTFIVLFFLNRNVNESADISQVEISDLVDSIKNNLYNGNTSVSVKASSESTVMYAIERVYDDPELFWLSRDYSISYVGKMFLIQFGVYYNNHNVMKTEIDRVVDSIIFEISDDMSDYAVALYVHDYLCNNIVYTDTDNENEHNIYGALVEGKCVCEGYAKSFMYIMNKLGKETLYFSGTSQKNGVVYPHSWNGVYLDSEFYYFDLTWDDIESEYVSYNNFAVTSTDILRNHSFDEFHPMIETDAYLNNYYYYNGYILDTYSKENVAEIIKKQSSVIDIKCSSVISYNQVMGLVSNPYQLNEVLKEADSDYTGFTGFSYISDEDTKCLRLYFE